MKALIAALALVTAPSSRAWLDETREQYRLARDEASRLCPAPHFVPDGATYLFARTVVLLGAGRAVLFPSLVPPFTLLVGFLALGEVPSVSQLIGLIVVVVGFQLTQKG